MLKTSLWAVPSVTLQLRYVSHCSLILKNHRLALLRPWTNDIIKPKQGGKWGCWLVPTVDLQYGIAEVCPKEGCHPDSSWDTPHLTHTVSWDQLCVTQHNQSVDIAFIDSPQNRRVSFCLMIWSSRLVLLHLHLCTLIPLLLPLPQKRSILFGVSFTIICLLAFYIYFQFKKRPRKDKHTFVLLSFWGLS